MRADAGMMDADVVRTANKAIVVDALERDFNRNDAAVRDEHPRLTNSNRVEICEGRDHFVAAEAPRA